MMKEESGEGGAASTQTVSRQLRPMPILMQSMTLAPQMTGPTLIDRLTAFFAARGLNAYLVGGVVRDRLLGRVSGADVDLAVEGDAVALGRELADELGGSLAPLNVPRGMMRVALPPMAMRPMAMRKTTTWATAGLLTCRAFSEASKPT